MGSKTASVPSTTIYEPIVAVVGGKDGEDDDELHHVTLDVDVPVVPQEQRPKRQRKKKRKKGKRKKKRRRMRRKNVTATGGYGQTTKGMDVCEEEILSGPGCTHRESSLQNEFNNLTFEL